MKISIEGYKSIASKCGVDCPGLTVLSGANSSGKSSFMQPLLLLKQTLENHYDSGSLSLDGENLKHTDARQVITKVPNYKKNTFGVFFENESGCAEVRFRRKQGTGLIVRDVFFKDDEDFVDGAHLHPGMKSEDIESQIPTSRFQFIQDLYEKSGVKAKWKIVQDRGFLRAELAGDRSSKVPIRAAFEPTGDLKKLVTRLIHVPGLRGNPERTYKISASDGIYPGSFEKYIASIINNWVRKKAHRKKIGLLKDNLRDLGLASDIKTEKINDTRVQIKVSRNKTGGARAADLVDIADVGFGVSQALPVLVALICAKKDQFVYIEQPELHLHPVAQFKLADIIISAIQRGVKVIIETHSSLLLRGIQIGVVERRLRNDLVSLNWFTQDPRDGATKVVNAQVDEFGAFGEWPVDFDDISLSVEQKYLDAVEKAMSER